MTTFKSAVLTAAALVGACGAPRALTRGALSARPVVEAVYECRDGPIVVYGDRSGPSLFDERHHQLARGRWSGSSTDRFVVLTGSESGHPIALEYVVPRDRAGTATLVTYDGADGAVFKVIADGDVWRIYGESSATSACKAGDSASAAARLQPDRQLVP
ncbi:MAG TPA: hypothetical protein VKB80_16795 [Kofleriaceae bacterium]|nr:hypothetical protein [Kofleriaceae bacterium]